MKLKLTDPTHLKILICFLIDRLGSLSVHHLQRFFEDLTVDYFQIGDAVYDLTATGAVSIEGDTVSLGSKGYESAKYADDVPFEFRNRLLINALSFLRSEDGMNYKTPDCCSTDYTSGELSFVLKEGSVRLVEIRLTGCPEECRNNISADPIGAYERITAFINNSADNDINLCTAEGSDSEWYAVYKDKTEFISLYCPNRELAEKIGRKIGITAPQRLKKMLLQPPPPINTEKYFR